MLAAVRRAGAAAILLLALPGPAEAVSQQDRICAHIRAVVQAKLDLGVGCDWEYPDNPLIFVAHVPASSYETRSTTMRRGPSR